MSSGFSRDNTPITLSGRERGEINVERVQSYLQGLRNANQSLPMENGRPRITAIAEASGVLRNAFYTNAKLKALIGAFRPSASGPEERQEDGNVTSSDSRTRQQLAVKDQRILDLEQQLTAAQAEVLALRKHNSDLERRLVCYKIIEEDILLAGRRVIL